MGLNLLRLYCSFIVRAGGDLNRKTINAKDALKAERRAILAELADLKGSYSYSYAN